MAYGRFIEPKRIEVTHHVIKNTRTQRDTFRIVQLSDIHMGAYVTLERLEHIVDHVNALSADAVVLTGDLLDNAKRYTDFEAVSKVLEKVEARRGKYAIFGNHEYENGGVDAYKKIVEQAKFELLVNQGTSVENISIYGADCALYGNRSPEFSSRLESHQFNILLLHQPDAVDKYFDYHYDLVLSGHTHDGQVKLPIIGTPILPELGRKYVAGWFEHNNRRRTKHYVNRGLGMTMLPFRFNSIPEISVFDIESTEENTEIDQLSKR